MEWIELELTGDTIAITFRPEVGDVSKVCHIRAREALVASLQFICEPPEQAVHLDVGEITLQFESWPHQRAWMVIAEDTEENGSSMLVACLEGGVIREIGQCLYGLYLAAERSSSTQDAPQAFAISYSYVENDEPDEADDLLE